MDNCYLLLGPELGQKNDFIEELKAKQPENTEFYKFYPWEDDTEGFVTALFNASIFSSTRFIILNFPAEYSENNRSTNLIKKSLADYILKFLNNPSAEVCLVISTVETRINKPIMDIIPKSNTKIFYEMFENQKSDWIRKYFSKNKLTISIEAVEEILVLVENNTKDLKDICSQLVTYFITCTEIKKLELNDIEKFLIHTRVETGFSLFSYLAIRDLESALDCIHTIYQTNAYQIPAILASLSWCFRRLESIQECITLKGENIADALLHATVLGSKASVYRYKDKQLYTKAVNNFSLTELKQAVVDIANYEVKLRQVPTDLHMLYLEKLMYVLAIK